MERAKLEDVAKRAGVSIATASVVLSGKGNISETVSHQVLLAAKELKYRRPAFRTSAGGKESRSIGVLAYECFEYHWNFMKPFIVSLESKLFESGYFPMVFHVSRGHKTETVLNRVLSSGVCGVCSIHYNNAELFNTFVDFGIPLVILNNSSFQRHLHTVCVDDFQGAYEGTRYLLDLGHRRILYVEYHRPDQPTVVADRFVGFKKALDEERLDFESGHRVTVDVEDLDEIERRLSPFLSGSTQVTAMFVHDDYLAARVVCVLQRLGVSVPRDVSVIAPGDSLPYSEPFCPQITTMRINTALMGDLAAQLMLDVVTKKTKDVQVLKVKEQLVDRHSCRKLG